MKVLMLNGSPHAKGNTRIALEEMRPIFEEQGIQTELVTVGNKDIRGCIGCRKCAETGRCVLDDVVNEIIPKFLEADGLVVGTPVYFSNANSTVMSLLTRMFFATMKTDKTMKVGATVTAVRRGGAATTFDEVNKFFTHAGMPIASGQYWNTIHGWKEGEAAQDVEGLQQMRTLARNMAFLLKSIELGKRELGLPEREPYQQMNFIR